MKLWRGGDFDVVGSLSGDSEDHSCRVSDCGRGEVVQLSVEHAEAWRVGGFAWAGGRLGERRTGRSAAQDISLRQGLPHAVGLDRSRARHRAECRLSPRSGEGASASN